MYETQRDVVLQKYLNILLV